MEMILVISCVMLMTTRNFTLVPDTPYLLTANQASWAAMTQSVGDVIGATGPNLLGWIHDATQSFFLAILEMIVINVLMIAVQFMAVPRKSKDTVDITVKGVDCTFSK